MYLRASFVKKLFYILNGFWSFVLSLDIVGCVNVDVCTDPVSFCETFGGRIFWIFAAELLYLRFCHFPLSIKS